MENLNFGLYVTGLGMLIVFICLILLMAIMYLLAFLNPSGRKGGNKAEGALSKSAEPVNAAVGDAASPSLLQAAITSPVSPLKAGSGEEVAAIAAVMAILLSDGILGTVTAVRPLKNEQKAWSLAGRRDIMAGRL
jgi:Na+-transporting methylmalonyl-CoA/oxaloacetate decarboxylase gamma subunit